MFYLSDIIRNKLTFTATYKNEIMYMKCIGKRFSIEKIYNGNLMDIVYYPTDA